jgi:hypothetical protein
MQGLSGCHHRVDVFCLVDKTLHHDGLLALEEFLHLCWQFIQIGTSDRFAILRFSEFAEIGVCHPSVSVSLLVEQILPLQDHALEIVVEKQDLNANIVLSRGGHF